MDSIEPNFSNNTIDISGLPDFEQVALNSVSKKLLTKHLLQIGVWFLLVIAFGVFMYFKEEIIIGAVISSILILFLLFLIFDVVKKQSLYGYAVREKDIIYQRGFMISKKTIVSFNRVQHVSINRSLLDKWLGIATLRVFTAGGSGSDIKIPGLDPKMAEKLKEVLSGKITKEDV